MLRAGLRWLAAVLSVGRFASPPDSLFDNAPLRRQLGAAGRAWATRNCWKESAEALFHPVAADPEP